MGRTIHSPLTGLLPVGNGLLHATSLRIVVGDPGRLRCDRGGSMLSQYPCDLQMLLPSGAFQHCLIGRLLDQYMLEGIDRLRAKAGFVEEFGGLELCEAVG